MMTSKHCYNDGVMTVYREIDRRTDFGAQLNVHFLDNMRFIAKLAFAEMSKRQQDIEFAEQRGFSLSTKIKTPFRRGLREIDNKCKCVIEGVLYDISFIDTTQTEMYFYLEEVGPLADADTGHIKGG